MLDPTLLDAKFKAIIKNIPQAIPDGIIEINDQIIKSFGVSLSNKEGSKSSQSRFYVIEAFDKITLINDQFVVWLFPFIRSESCKETLTFIARHDLPRFQMELAFSTKKQYNHPSIVLELLQCFLEEISENEGICEEIVKKQN